MPRFPRMAFAACGQQRLALVEPREAVGDLARAQSGITRLRQLTLGLGEPPIVSQHIRQEHTGSFVSGGELNRAPQVLDALSGLLVDPIDQTEQSMRFGISGSALRRQLQMLARGLQMSHVERRRGRDDPRASVGRARQHGVAGDRFIESRERGLVVASTPAPQIRPHSVPPGRSAQHQTPGGANPPARMARRGPAAAGAVDVRRSSSARCTPRSACAASAGCFNWARRCASA